MKDLRNASQVGRLQFLSEAARREIYVAVLDILTKVGMRVDHEEATAMLLDAGCSLTGDERILMPRHLVEQARRSVPPVVDVYDRAGEPAMELGGYNSY